jgi:hypothetical protein
MCKKRCVNTLGEVPGLKCEGHAEGSKDLVEIWDILDACFDHSEMCEYIAEDLSPIIKFRR